MRIGSPHSKSVTKVESELETSNRGLTPGEAKARLERHGANTLKEKKRRSKLAMFLDQFKDFMVIVLLFAVVLSFIIAVNAYVTHGDTTEFIDPVAIMLIVILNAVFGYAQENRAEKALDALKAMTAPTATVVRNGVVLSIPAKELVVGDLVMLEAGTKAPADIRLVETVSLNVDEASLTGESVAVEKDASAVLEPDALLGDRKNMVFSSCLVEAGRGRGYVTATGMDTEIGKIAGMIQEEERPPTPLQVKLDKLGKQIGYIIIGVCAVIFLTGALLRGQEMMDMFLIAVSLAVAAVPEGLPAVVTISLALGLQRMARKHALIRQLPAVETLGSTQVICTDKTGTLTKGEMTVRRVWTFQGEFEVTGTGFSPEGTVTGADGKTASIADFETLRLAGLNGLLNSNAELVQRGGGWTVQGTSTEGALVALAGKLGIKDTGTRIDERPFDSKRKMMSSLHAVDGKMLTFTKGAPDFVLDICTHYHDGLNIHVLSDETKERISRANDEMAGAGMRVLALAFKRDTEAIEEEGLTFLGLAGMMDPPREEVFRAVEQCKKAGIDVVMITGDHLLTAKAIAAEIGIFDESRHKAVTGAQLEKMPQDELETIVEDVRVYARVSPEHKIKIVKAWKAKGKVVAMTGDGVNDAPALRGADIGVAMGITGTDVSKDASVMVLTDDNFASIVDAVEEGRGIYDNIRKFVTYLLACNGGEVLTVFAGIILGLPLPLLALQILWINLVTDGPPALALGVEPISKGIMEKPPRDPKESILSKDIVVLIVLMSFMTFAGAFTMYYLHHGDDLEKGRTMAFVTLIISQNLFVLSAKSLEEPLISTGLLNNKWLLLAVAFAILACLPVVYVPFLQEVFGTVSLSLDLWLDVIIVASFPFMLSETFKFLKKALA